MEVEVVVAVAEVEVAMVEMEVAEEVVEEAEVAIRPLSVEFIVLILIHKLLFSCEDRQRNNYALF